MDCKKLNGDPDRNSRGCFVSGHSVLSSRDSVNGRFVSWRDRYPMVSVEVDRFLELNQFIVDIKNSEVIPYE